MSDMFKDLEPLNQSASFFLERSKVIQGNIANANTPFYKPVDLKFEKIFNQQINMKIDNPKHIVPEGLIESKFTEIPSGYMSGYDQNKVIIEEEMAKLAESSIMYKTMVEIMKKEMVKLKVAISGK